MTQPTSIICPLLSVGKFEPAPCLEHRCAWWDALAGSCCIASSADSVSVQDVANQIRALTISLEELAANSQALANLEKKELPGAVKEGANVRSH